MFDTSSSPDINLGNKDSLSSSRYVFSEMLDETCLYNAVTTSSNGFNVEKSLGKSSLYSGKELSLYEQLKYQTIQRVEILLISMMV